MEKLKSLFVYLINKGIGMTKVITISVKNEEEWIIEELKKIAKKKGMPISQIVIDAVKEEIKKHK